MLGPLQSNQINRTALGNKGLNFIEEITGHKCLMLIFNTYFKNEIPMLCKFLESRNHSQGVIIYLSCLLFDKFTYSTTE